MDPEQQQHFEALRHQLRLRLANCSMTEIAALMGYQRPGSKVKERLHKLLEDRLLGLGSASFDFRYSGAEFLRCLCEVLGADLGLCRQVIAAYDDYNTRRLHAWPSVIFVDTGPKEKGGTSVFALAMLQTLRSIRLPEEQRLKPVAEQVEWVRETVRRHYREHDGRLHFWGAIRRYMFCYQENTWLELTPAGDVITEHHDWHPLLVSVSVGGREFDIGKLVNPGGSND